jgi:hypothetical protein
MSVASTYLVRHGYGHNRGVQFFCTPPLCSRGVQKFLYATEDNSSYSYFPSSEKTKKKVVTEEVSDSDDDNFVLEARRKIAPRRGGKRGRK